MNREQVITRVREVLDTEPRIRTSGTPIHIGIEPDGRVVMDGEMATVAAKKLAITKASTLPDVITIVDRLRVAPARAFSDEQIRRRLLDLLADEPVFSRHELHGSTAPDAAAERASDEVRTQGPRIDFHVADGVVALEGRVPSLDHKRLAGVLAWWVPGTCDVENHLAVEPPQQDNDMEITEAVRLVLEKDPIVDAERVNVSVRDRVVHLVGAVAAAEERDAAEADAWYVLGVADVRNDIAVTK